MTDVHELEIERRGWRIWPIVVAILAGLFLIGILVAMIMNIHGSISWPAGEVKFGFWPAATTIEPPARVATDVAPATNAPSPPASELSQAAEPAALQPPPGVTSPDDPCPQLPAPCAPLPVQ